MPGVNVVEKPTTGVGSKSRINVTYMNKRQPLIMWCEELGLDYSIVYQRLARLKWSVKDAFEIPVKQVPSTEYSDQD